MPPKKRTKEPVQTKLPFLPVSATKPAALFTAQAPVPLRSHMAILNNKSIHATTTTTTTTTVANAIPSNAQHSSSFSTDSIGASAAASYHDEPQIGGNTTVSGSGVVKSTPPPSPLISTEAMRGFRSSTVNGVVYDHIPGCGTTESPVESWPTGGESRKRKAVAEAGEDDTGMRRKREESGSEDELLSMPDATRKHHIMPSSSSSSSTTTTPPASRSTPTSTVSGSLPAATSKLSLLEQMATPRGTQPLPRPSERTNPKSAVGFEAASKLASRSEQMYNSSNSVSRGSSSAHGKTSSRPIAISSSPIASPSPTISDDGFVSGSNLDARIQGLFNNRESSETLSPPRSLSRSSSKSGSQLSLSQKSQQQQQQSSQRTSMQSQSQIRSGDFASLSLAKSTKRVLPPTLARTSGPGPGYQPVSTYQAGVHTSSTTNMAALSRTSSASRGGLASSQGRVRSSSPASSQGVTNMSGSDGHIRNVTKDGMLLSDEQQHVLDQVMKFNRNVFFTGSAGTGKSVLLRELIFRLRSKFSLGSGKKELWDDTNDAVAVTASTGIAACNIGGCTLHSFAGVGLGQEALPVLQAKVRKSGNAMRRWQDTRVLIIDEISMIDAGYMDKLEALARIIRKDDRPWGGIQLVLTGDFFQLPPVNKNGNVKFCFEGEAWTRTINTTIQLQQVFRQKDQTFADMLNEMRLGQMSPKTTDRFRSLTRDLVSGDGLRPTELFPLRNQVEEANNRMLNNLPGKTVVYQARDRGVLKDKMEQNCIAPTNLQLKINAQVMLLRNQAGGAGGLVNGSLGILIGFVARPADNENPAGSGGERSGSLNTPGEELPLVRFTLEGGATREMVVGREEWVIELPNGELQGARIQIPLGLAWSLSIHKSQGQTLPKVKVDLGKVFEKGQAYVALSRATSLEGLQVLNFDPRKVMVHPKVIEFYNQLRVYKK